MTREIVGRIVSAVVGLALVGAAIYLIVTGHEHADTILVVGLALAGAAGTVALPSVRGSK